MTAYQTVVITLLSIVTVMTVLVGVVVLRFVYDVYALQHAVSGVFS
jgi:hypothetical protein